MMRLAAREADVVSVAMGALPGGGLNWPDASPASFDAKLRLIREAAGERYASLEVNLLMQKTVVTDNPRQAAEAQSPAWGIRPEAVLETPLALLGSVESMAEQLQARRERWDASYVCVFADAMEAFGPVIAKLAGT